MKHEMQHSEGPTWCIHCGDFDPDPREDCGADRTGEFDSREKGNADRMFRELFGMGERP